MTFTIRIKNIIEFTMVFISLVISLGLRYTRIREYLSTFYKKKTPAKATNYKIGIPGAKVIQSATWFKKKLYWDSIKYSGPSIVISKSF